MNYYGSLEIGSEANSARISRREPDSDLSRDLRRHRLRSVPGVREASRRGNYHRVPRSWGFKAKIDLRIGGRRSQPQHVVGVEVDVPFPVTVNHIITGDAAGHG